MALKVGIIGGSGLDDPKLLKNFQEVEVNTPYGRPSSKITCGKIGGADVYIIARHGKNHSITPTGVNNRANIYALQKLGCTHVIATSAVGSLREEIKRGDFVVLDQFIDFTRQRKVTFHEKFAESPKHTPMAEPFSDFLRKKIISACQKQGIAHHPKGTVITIEGPRFSTKAESKVFRLWGADVINMSIAPEAILANELGLQYSAIAMSTDYDCWKESEEPVSWEAIVKIFGANAEKMKKLLVEVVENIGERSKEEEIKSAIRTIPNWPKPGVMYRDITTLIRNAEAFNKVIEILEKRYCNKGIDLIVGIESRGFIVASALATRLKKGIVLVRKAGKLPHETIKEEYALEYGKDSIEIHKDSITPGQRILVIDDLLATGGTCAAAGRLIERLGGKIVECAFVVELPELKGREKLKWPVFKIVDFEGE